ncbi:hypothetical protein V1512DRAFT_252807 [Lipomyces arxii]|uniref:uncharacterized protein n=1 Tax=Lipomyces arxii TaxID=56418 RepID=UPI0034CEA94C
MSTVVNDMFARLTAVPGRKLSLLSDVSVDSPSSDISMNGQMQPLHSSSNIVTIIDSPVKGIYSSDSPVILNLDNSEDEFNLIVDPTSRNMNTSHSHIQVNRTSSPLVLASSPQIARHSNLAFTNSVFEHMSSSQSCSPTKSVHLQIPPEAYSFIDLDDEQDDLYIVPATRSPETLYNYTNKNFEAGLPSGSESCDSITESSLVIPNLGDILSRLSKKRQPSTESQAQEQVAINRFQVNRQENIQPARKSKSVSSLMTNTTNAQPRPVIRSASVNMSGTYGAMDIDDLIETSSSPYTGSALKRKRGDEKFQPAREYSERTKSALHRLESLDVSKFINAGTSKTKVIKEISQDTDPDTSSDIDDSQQRRNVGQSQQENRRAPKTIGATKSRDQQTRKTKPSSEKTFVREQRRQEKEQQAIEKERQREIASVNTLKKSKKDTCTEMKVDIDKDLSETATGKHLQSILAGLGISVSVTWSSPTANMIKWRRKVVAEYNEALDQFMPIPEEICKENFIMVVLTGIEFVDMVIENRASENANSIQRLFPGQKIIFLIEGLNSVLKKLTTQTRREFQNKVHNAMGSNEGSSKTRTVSKNNEANRLAKVQSLYNYKIHPEMIEDAMITLQVIHNCLIFHSSSAIDSAEWISILTQDISTIPYKKARVNIHETICMEAGQVKAGTDNTDTFQQALQQIKFVTPGLSKSISNKYNNIDAMMKDLKVNGENVFCGLSRGREELGQATRKTGTKLAKDIAFIFTCRDPDALLS